MYCTECGNEMPADARFCAQCGTPATAVDPKGDVMAGTVEESKTPSDDPAESADVELEAQQKGEELTVEAAASDEGTSPTIENVPAGPEPRFSVKQIACMAVAGVAAAAAIVCIVMFCMNPPDTTIPANGTSSSSSEAQSSSSAANTSNSSAASSSNTSSAAAVSTNANGEVLPDSDSRYYTQAELESLSDHDLYLARNEIYARHGRGFKNQDLVEWFSSKDWYVQRYTPAEFDALPDQRNEYERANSDLIIEIETARNSQYL